MSLPKKIAAIAAPIAGIALLLAVPASAQNAQTAGSPKAEQSRRFEAAGAPAFRRRHGPAASKRSAHSPAVDDSVRGRNRERRRPGAPGRQRAEIAPALHFVRKPSGPLGAQLGSRRSRDSCPECQRPPRATPVRFKFQVNVPVVLGMSSPVNPFNSSESQL